MKIKRNVSLQQLNTLSAPSVASYYCCAATLDELRAAIRWASEATKPFYILGGGSNSIPRDFINGLVIQPKLKGIEQQEVEDDNVIVSAGAGENWHQLVVHCVKQGLYGIENLALIPGDCGAAPIQNIGAYGVELKDVFFKLDALNIVNLAVEEFSINDCQFGYRDSVFKQSARGCYVITRISLLLSRKSKLNMEYKALKEAVTQRGLEKPTIKDIADIVMSIREAKLPDPSRIPNAGSFFKNPIVDEEKFLQLKQRFPEVVAFDVGAGSKKIAAAWLLDTLGWKGKSVHGVRIHSEHALVLTNPRRLSANKILLAADEIKQDVENAFGIHLEVEPQILGTLL